jgi:hypothetical protein
MSNSAKDLSVRELAKYAHALAVMMLRYCPKMLNKFYSAQEIALYLYSLPLGSHSTFYASIDDMKLAFKDSSLKKSLLTLYPGQVEFGTSRNALSCIAAGQKSFNNGFQIKFTQENIKIMLPANVKDINYDGVLNHLRSEIKDVKRDILNLIYPSGTMSLQPSIMSIQQSIRGNNSFMNRNDGKFRKLIPKKMSELNTPTDSVPRLESTDSFETSKGKHSITQYE